MGVGLGGGRGMGCCRDEEAWRETGGERGVDGMYDGGCVYVYMIYEVLRLRPGCLGGVWVARLEVSSSL